MLYIFAYLEDTTIGGVSTRGEIVTCTDGCHDVFLWTKARTLRERYVLVPKESEADVLIYRTRKPRPDSKTRQRGNIDRSHARRVSHERELQVLKLQHGEQHHSNKYPFSSQLQLGHYG